MRDESPEDALRDRERQGHEEDREVSGNGVLESFEIERADASEHQRTDDDEHRRRRVSGHDLRERTEHEARHEAERRHEARPARAPPDLDAGRALDERRPRRRPEQARAERRERIDEQPFAQPERLALVVDQACTPS